MSSYHITTRHNGKTAFESEIDHHKIIMDTSLEHEGEDLGPSPKKLFLSALAGCTGMDVVALLKKMRVEFSDFKIVTEAELTTEHPKVFSKILVTYYIKTEEKNHEKVEKAVNLSQEKYCGVTAMLRKNSPVDSKIVFL